MGHNKLYILRHLHIVHFNDIYNIDMSYKEEPKGGARKFAYQVKKFLHLQDPLPMFQVELFINGILVMV